MTSLGAVVVLHEPRPEDLEHLAELRTECKDLLAVDNTPDAVPELAERLAMDGVDAVVNANAGGIAGAHNRGMAVLFDRGVDAVVLLDQDSRVGADFFDVMRRSCDSLGPQPFAIAPRVFDVNDERYLPELLFRGRFRVRKLADNTVAQRVAALRFFYTRALKRSWNIEETPYPKKRKCLPDSEPG